MMSGHLTSPIRAAFALTAAVLLSTTMSCSNSEPTIPQGSMSVGPDACVGVIPSVQNPLLPLGTKPADCERPGICVGQPAANWSAYDFQDRSCGYGQKYGLKDFRGKVTVLVHLAGWCAYCQNQTIKLEQMRMELARQGAKLNFLIINAKNADNDKDRKALVENCSFAVFQDHADFGIWDLNGGGKDDMYIYDPSGILLEYLPHNTLTTDLSTQANYDGLRDKLLNLARRFSSPDPGDAPGSSTGGTSGGAGASGVPSSGLGPDTTATSTGA